MEFKEFRKIPRLSREVVITEKIDGTNGVIAIGENGEFSVGSRTLWLVEIDASGNVALNGDNRGFAAWAMLHKVELIQGLGVGYHYGEWWGKGIGRGYGISDKRFSLFNTHLWGDTRPDCCDVVPVIYSGVFSSNSAEWCIQYLADNGSIAAPGYMNPEGIVIYHTAGDLLFKKTVKDDEYRKNDKPVKQEKESVNG